jgi:thymidylate synthase
MVKCYSGRTADNAWSSAARALLSAPKHVGRGGETLELLHVAFTIEDPIARWVTIRTPAINPAFALVEAIWILAGRKDAAMPTFWNPALPRFAGEGEEFHGAYGWRLRHHFHIDQIERAVAALGTNPDTRQVVLQIWDPAADLPGLNGEPVAEDIPCNTASYLKARDGRLEWLQVMRSNDAFLGTPHNIVQFSILQEIIAGRIGLGLGSYTVVTDSFHVYAKDVESVRNSIEGAPLTTKPPLFSVSDSKWAQILGQLVATLDNVRTAAAPSALEAQLENCSHFPADWPSAMAVIIADAARRRNWFEVCTKAEAAVSNLLLRNLWDRWSARVTQPQEPL